MSKFPFHVPLILLGALAFMYWYVCRCQCNECFFGSKSSTPVVETVKLPSVPFIVKDQPNRIVAQSDASLKFLRNGATPITAQDIEAKFPDIAAYLKNNAHKKLEVIGLYAADEKNTTTFENLGLARADALKQKLVKAGIVDTLILTKAQLQNGLSFYKDTLYGGIDFNFWKKMLVKAEDAKKLFEPRPVYFETGKSVIKTDAALQKYFEDLKLYLVEEPNSKLVLTGHTDDTGLADKNLVLGKARAEQVKGQIAKMGISATRITTETMGQTKPLAPNTTAEGRAQNRRVDMVVQLP